MSKLPFVLRHLRCASLEDIQYWLGSTNVERPPGTDAFCEEADRVWCLAQRKARKCFRSGAEFSELCEMDKSNNLEQLSFV